MFFFCYGQPNVRRLLPVSDYCRARGNQIVEHSSDNETVLGSSRKLRGTSEHLIDGSEKMHLSVELLNFRVRMLLKGSVIQQKRGLLNHTTLFHKVNF